VHSSFHDKRSLSRRRTRRKGSGLPFFVPLHYHIFFFRSSSKPPGGMIVILNEFPGTAKHTILKLVQALLPADKSWTTTSRSTSCRPSFLTEP
ncbi:hypothetical protein CPB85DRAFT_421261, partial [Mucidula mucida]